METVMKGLRTPWRRRQEEEEGRMMVKSIKGKQKLKSGGRENKRGLEAVFPSRKKKTDYVDTHYVPQRCLGNATDYHQTSHNSA